MVARFDGSEVKFANQAATRALKTLMKPTNATAVGRERPIFVRVMEGILGMEQGRKSDSRIMPPQKLVGGIP